MSSVVLALQVVVAVQVLQGVALFLGLVWLSRRLRAATEEIAWRDRAQVQPLARGMSELESNVRGARAEAATYLEAVFSGVRGIIRGLDQMRETNARFMQQVQKRKLPPAPDGSGPSVAEQAPSGEVVSLREVTTAVPRRSAGNPG